VKIHPLAVVSPAADLGRNVEIGPFCVIEAGAVLGDGCVLRSHVVIKAGTTLGKNNHVCEGAVLGGFPQHVKTPKQLGKVLIGDSNTFREHVTVHRSLDREGRTMVGDSNLLMVGSHVGHDSAVGSHCVLVNNVLLAGHVEVHDRAILSGAVAIHQFCRIGQFAMVGGFARVIKDIPPYVTVDGASGLIVGLNVVGLRRNGFTSAAITELKQAYRLIYRSGLPWAEMLVRLREEFSEGAPALFSEFLAGGKRGVTAERRGPATATIKLASEIQPPKELHRKAG